MTWDDLLERATRRPLSAFPQQLMSSKAAKGKIEAEAGA